MARARFLKCCLCTFSLLTLWVLSVPRAFAQYTPDDLAGIKPTESYQHSDIDSVNLGNGSLALHIPLISYPQRGNALKVEFQLLYNGRWMQSSQTCDELAGTCTSWTQRTSLVNGALFGSASAYLPNGIYPNEIHTLKSVTKNFTFIYPNSTTYTYHNYRRMLYEGDGTAHVMGNTGTSTVPPTGGSISETGPWRALDGSGWLWRTDGTPVARNGVTYPPTGTGLVTDPNGNQITYSASSITDTLGRNIPAPLGQTASDFSGCTGALPTSAAYLWLPPEPGGAAAGFKFCYAVVPGASGFPNCFGCTATSAGTQLQSVVLPNSTAYTFEYNDRDTGDPQTVNYGSIMKITLPTGGSISYAYITGQAFTYFSNSGSDQTDLTTYTRVIASRTVTDSTGSHIWTYAGNTRPFANTPETVTVTDPLSNATTHQFNVNYDGSTYETVTAFYKGSVSASNLLRSVTLAIAPTTTIYQGVINLQPSTRTTTLENNQVTKETYTYDSGFTFVDLRGSPSRTALFGKVVLVSSFDYGTGAAGAPLRTTTSTYAWQSPNTNYTNYLANNLLDLFRLLK
ncbi:MAG TPA: hypothetical protein VI386_07445 [Candidatus Sulfotelmatobacter sp.]